MVAWLVDEDGGENGNENDSRLDMEMRTRMILIGLCPSFLGLCAWGPPPGLQALTRRKTWAGDAQNPTYFLFI